jgi:hypothetical protein
VNAAFLLVATAWAAGEQPATAPAAPAAPAHVAAAPAGGCCGGGGDCGCNDCCECKPSLCERLKARFHKHSCCDACDTCSSCGGGHASCNTCAPSCDCGCECKPSWKDRMKAHFHKSSCCDACDTCGGCGGGYGGTIVPGGAPTTMPKAEPIKAPKDGEPGQKLPTGGKVQLSPIVPEVAPVTNRTFGTETKNPFELDRRYEARVDRAADYGWVTGQLFYVHADGGLWVLRYAPLSKEDPNGGSVVLARDRQMDSYREGDLVTVHGEILNQKSSLFLGGPLYRARSIQLVDRSQP